MHPESFPGDLPLLINRSSSPPRDLSCNLNSPVPAVKPLRSHVTRSHSRETVSIREHPDRNRVCTYTLVRTRCTYVRRIRARSNPAVTMRWRIEHGSRSGAGGTSTVLFGHVLVRRIPLLKQTRLTLRYCPYLLSSKDCIYIRAGSRAYSLHSSPWLRGWVGDCLENEEGDLIKASNASGLG
jgi:hypothetical protein